MSNKDHSDRSAVKNKLIAKRHKPAVDSAYSPGQL